MKFKAVLLVSPGGPFGVPEPGRTVFPSGDGVINLHGPTLDTHAGQFVGHGTLSAFRPESDRIHDEIKLSAVSGRFDDNYMKIEVDANDRPQAVATIAEEIECFFQHLTLEDGRVFTYEWLTLSSEDGQNYPVPTEFELSSVTVYDLGGFSARIVAAQKYAFVSDERLDRALDYFEHAVLLNERRSAIAGSMMSRHFRILVSSIFLNFWKAATVIAGDPSTAKDYQSRFREFGLPKSFKGKLDTLHDIRNKFDVAHSSIIPDALQTVQDSYGESQKIVTELITAYRNHLYSKSVAQQDR